MEYPPLTRIQGAHAGSSLYHMNDGYFYSRCNQRVDTVYFRCSKSGSGCFATAVLSSGLFQSSMHNHPPNHLHVPIMLERQRLINEASNLEFVNFADIFSSTRNLFPDVLTPHSLQPAMARMRSLALPDKPSTLPGLDEILQNERFKCLSAIGNFEDTIYAGSTVSEDGCFIILLLSSKGKEFMKLSIVLFTLTAPFEMLGAPHHYVVHVIYTLWDGTIIILAWFLMERISDQGFIAACSLLKSVLEERHFKTILCLHGSTEARAYKVVFAPVNVTFCLQDFVENVGKFLRSENFHNEIHLMNIASLLCALPIIPSDFTHFGLDYIQQEVRRFEALAGQANILLEYVQSQWVNVLTDFSVCGDYYRTSDINDTVRRRMLRIIDTHKNNIYSFTRAIASVAEVSQKDILDLQRGKKVQQRRAVSISDEQEIQVLTMGLVHPYGSPMDAVVNLLKTTSLKIKHILLNQLGTSQAVV